MSLANLSLEEWGHVATIATGIAALLALFLGIWQVNKSRRAQERATAFDIYTQFLSKAIEYPEFLEVKLTKQELESQVIGGSAEKFARYEIYFDLMIVTFEHLFRESPNSEEMKSYARSYLDGHRTYLCSDRFQKQFLNQLRPELKPFVVELCASWGSDTRRLIQKRKAAA